MRPVWLLLLLSLLLSFVISTTSVAFNCSTATTTTCQGMIGYIPPNATNVFSITTLFQVESLYSLLAANSWPLSSSDRAVLAGSRVRIPFPCKCKNGKGASDGGPVYVVKKGDGLDAIARTIFGEFVTYQEIADANGIPDPNKIYVDQKLAIPLPCSCDDVAGARVVHYGHVVASGSSVAGIAQEFGTTSDTLLSLNPDAKELKAGQILDVPLKACNASMSSDSLESSLLVPNGSNHLTANNCVQCSCNLEDMQLQCKETQGLTNISKWSQCPSTQCSGNLSLGESTNGTCVRTTCSYGGYTNSRILTALTNQSTCSTPGNSAARIEGNGWKWRGLFVSLVISLLSFSSP